MKHITILNPGRYLNKLLTGLSLLPLLLLFLPAEAQYFGQNKMRYKNLKFKVEETPHYSIYHYLKNDSLLQRLAQEGEIWYELHQQVFRDTFTRKNPLIVYNNHPDFQQTTAIQGEIGVGTGGVTEGLKNRVIMPVLMTNQQTRHVLGHELVHAFQYHHLIEGDSTRLENIGNLPLWMVEGMAEYLSIGKKDAFTAMWMRDAYLNKDIPSLRDLTETNKYFPYRYGQAFWSFIGSTYGDTVIVPLFKATAKFGYEGAIRRTFGYDVRTLSNLWNQSIIDMYRPMLKDTVQTPVGRLIIDEKNAGNTNVAPAISPDGRYVAFLSEKDLFSIDLFLADAHTGKIIRKLTSRLSNGDIDDFSYVESAGSFSPDSRQFAFSVFSGGRNRLMIVDVARGRTVLSEGMGDVGEFSNITWSPDGEHLAFTGLKEGQGDLYMFNIKTKKLTQLTNDWYSDTQPAFSRDGSKIVFSTDRVHLRNNGQGVEIVFNLSVLDVKTGRITDIDIFPGANNLNPQFSADDSQIYFLSNGDGFRNLYRYTLDGGKVERLTDYFTGISGITEYSPALSLSAQGDVLYSYYRAHRYNIYNAKTGDFTPVEVAPYETDFTAAMLPPLRSYGVDIINANLDNFNRFQRIDTVQIAEVPYRPQFKLDYLANSGVGVAVNTRYGSGLSSGIQGMFSDILGRNQIFAGLAVNGEIYDFGGQVAYINQKSRINWGGAVSHIPYVSGFSMYDQRDIGRGGEELVLDTYIIRTFQQQAEVFGAYPFSRTKRFEVGGAIARYSYRVDRWWQDYWGYAGGRDKIPLDEVQNTPLGMYYGNLQGFTIQQLNAAFVGDNSVFGVAAPLDGYRYRVGVEQYFGDFGFSGYTIDGRRYKRLKPVTLAGRAYSYMRVGRDENRLYPIFIGYPYLIRGYESASFYNNGQAAGGGLSINQLMGSRMAVLNLEMRLPFTGPERLAVIKSGLLFSDLNVFFDAGLSWSGGDRIKLSGGISQIGTEPIVDGEGNQVGTRPVYEDVRIPVMSAGVSLRVNLFGALILEPYYAIPFQRSDVKFGTFGLNFAPGW